MQVLYAGINEHFCTRTPIACTRKPCATVTQAKPAQGDCRKLSCKLRHISFARHAQQRMFRSIQTGCTGVFALRQLACAQSTPFLRYFTNASFMDAFRQRKSIAGRVTTRSYTANVTKSVPTQSVTNPQLAPLSNILDSLASNTDAAPRKQRKRKAQPAELPSAEPSIAGDTSFSQPLRSKAFGKAAPTERKPRSKKATASQTPAGTELRTTADIEAAEPSSKAAEDTSAAHLQSAPSGVPASLPSGLPADPAVLRCWTKESMAEAAKYLADTDPALAPLISQHGVPSSLLAKGFSNMFNSLALSILGQQLAVKAAKVIQGRFMALCQCDQTVTPEAVLAVTQEQLRAVGLSNAKARYVLDLASHFKSGQLSDAKIATMDDETLIAELTKVKGIGQWTVDMFAMFHLGRPDIFPLGDLAVRKGLIHLYTLKAKPSVAEMDVIGNNWAPYRSLGSYYMWRLPIHQKPSKKKATTSGASDAVPSTGVVPSVGVEPSIT